MTNKKIIIAGGTGFIGHALAAYFGGTNTIIILSRGGNHAHNNNFGNSPLAGRSGNVHLVRWNGKDAGDWCKEIDGADVVINLTGKSVNCRYTAKNKREIFDSRTNSTKAIGNAIYNATVPPKLWLNAASATIYRNATDRPQDEYTGEIENDFSVQVCKLWEKTFFDQRTPFTRKVALRMAVTLGNGGVMVPYLNLCKFGLGGRQGSGKQMFSWVHAEDICRAVDFFFEHAELEGVYNVCSPNPVSNQIFMQTLRRVTGHFFGLPAFAWMLKIGAVLIGTETELLLKSRWVVPAKLTEAGFSFKYAKLDDAFTAIISQMPRKRYHLF
ncbi:MAG TPA: TIGR01777 family oxidoreductase [Chitinophagaceae bacterium]|nr:TIGR01777 family oxidoreductase [Chitinophagaceae bacterium]